MKRPNLERGLENDFRKVLNGCLKNNLRLKLKYAKSFLLLGKFEEINKVSGLSAVLVVI